MHTLFDLQPQAVHILAGTNDVYPGWQLSDTANNIETMVKKAKEHHIAVVIGTIPPWGPEPCRKKRIRARKGLRASINSING